MNNTLTPEARRKRIEGIIKIVGLLVAGFVIAPFVFIAIKGLIGAAIAAVIAFLVIHFTPVVAAVIANWRLKAIKAEAAKNPVETLQNDFMVRQGKLVEFRTSIRNFMSEVSNFADKLQEFVAQYPQEADKFKNQLSKMRQLLKLREQKYKEANQNLDEYALEIKKVGAIWDMSQAAAKMNDAAGLSNEDFLAKIQVETALDSVQKALSNSYADLEMCLLDEEIDNSSTNQKSSIKAIDIPNDPIDTMPVLKKEKVKILS